ncbi:MAG: hypothetical protein R3F65_22315 [bacterium]
MNRDLFQKILSSRDELRAEGAGFTSDDKSQVAVLVHSTSGGPTPIAKVNRVDLRDDFVAIETAEAVYCLPYDQIAGLRVGKRGESAAPRTGFRA